MSGHSKWANIKHKKAKSDEKKGKEFTKVAKDIIIAVKTAGAVTRKPIPSLNWQCKRLKA